jgi:FKBP-type peptidyl-prolyl cis-trans isomerase SlyD
MRIGPNSFVSFECSLTDETGELIDGDDSSDRVDYVHGYGMLVIGLEIALLGLQAGDRREIVVPPSSGYGDRDEELVLEVDRTDFPDAERVREGDEFFMEYPDGGTEAVRIVEVRTESVVVDANHPLAGRTLRYCVNVLLVRPAADEEIERAARELAESEEEEDEDEDECGPACSHQELHPAEELVTLGVKKKAPN